MKEILKVFIPVFLLFFAVGIFYGWDDRREVASDKLFAQMEVSRTDGHYFMEVRHEGEYHYRYSVDDHSIDLLDESLATTVKGYNNSLGKTSKRQNEIVAQIGNIIGPTAGIGITAERAIALTKKPKLLTAQSLRKNLTVLVGTICGYYVGEWVGSNYKTSPDSELAIGLLKSDTSMWKRAAHLKLKATLIELQTNENARLMNENNTNKLADDPIRMCACSFYDSTETVLQRLLNSRYHITSANFREVDLLKRKHDSVKNSDSYKWIKAKAVYHEASRHTQATDAINRARGYSPELWRENCRDLCSQLE